MDNAGKGEHLLPRLAPIPRSLAPKGDPAPRWRISRSAPVTCRWVGAAMETVAAGLSRSLSMVPVLELFGIALLFLMFSR